MVEVIEMVPVVLATVTVWEVVAAVTSEVAAAEASMTQLPAWAKLTVPDEMVQTPAGVELGSMDSVTAPALVDVVTP